MMGLPSLHTLDEYRRGAQRARIRLASEATDMRCGFDRLAERVGVVIGEDSLSGHLFVFRSRRGTAIRILVYNGQGFWLAQKRLSKGRFRWWPEGRSTRGVARWPGSCSGGFTPPFGCSGGLRPPTGVFTFTKTYFPESQPSPPEERVSALCRRMRGHFTDFGCGSAYLRYMRASRRRGLPHPAIGSLRKPSRKSVVWSQVVVILTTIRTGNELTV